MKELIKNVTCLLLLISVSQILFLEDKQEQVREVKSCTIELYDNKVSCK